MSLLKYALQVPDKAALIIAETGAEVSFGELNDRSTRLSRVLRKTLDVGDRMAVLMENSPNYFVAAWASRRSGLRVVPINWHLGVDEAAYIITNSDARALIASPGLADVAQAAADRSPDLALLLADGDAFGRFEGMKATLDAEPREPLQPELEGDYMFYSSGTTGQPKGILRPLSGALFGEPHMIERLISVYFGFDEETRYYTPAPLYHAAPLGWCVGTQALGGTAVIPARFDAEAALRHIEQYRITHAQFVPTHFVRFLQLPEEVRRRYDLSSLRVVIHAAAPCPVPVKEQMLAWWGPIIYEYYSQSELAGFTEVGPQEWLTHKGTVGCSKTGRIHIVDEEGRELSPGQTGHILFEGSERFEYHKTPEKTADYFNEQGWSRPGDMGWVDEEGYLYLADRASHMIISGGVNIYPQEIEAVLALHPAVRDVAVIGVPDLEFGEAVKAVVEPAAGTVPDEAVAAELMQFCRSRLAGFKCPRSVDFVDALPRLPTGKLPKHELRKRYWGEGRQLI